MPTLRDSAAREAVLERVRRLMPTSERRQGMFTAPGRLIQRVGTEPAAGVHPKFGPLTQSEWDRLAWKHRDHHLRQFGV